jgi:probable rRNA maturation factor
LRSVDSVTDVLSFPSLDGILDKKVKKSEHLEDVDEEGNLVIGSIAICTQRAKEQADEFGHSYTRELNYLATHGVCHLLGYDHMQEDEKAAMREKEERVLMRINITRD